MIYGAFGVKGQTAAERCKANQSALFNRYNQAKLLCALCDRSSSFLKGDPTELREPPEFTPASHSSRTARGVSLRRSLVPNQRTNKSSS
jgi:hypothetical protein